MISLSNRPPLVILLGALLGLLSSCGDGGSGPSPQTPTSPTTTPAVVEYLPTVLTAAPDEAARYSLTPNTSQLKYSGSSPPTVGSVLILDGTAYKIVKRDLTQQGLTTLGTAPPDFEDVFERLTISTEVALTQTQASIGRARPLASLALPSLTLKSDLLSPMELAGSLTNGNAIIEFDYQRGIGIRKAKLLVQGDS